PTSPTDIYTLSLHDALPICRELLAALAHPLELAFELPGLERLGQRGLDPAALDVFPGVEDAGVLLPDHLLGRVAVVPPRAFVPGDRKSTRLNSSHLVISYAV